MGVTLTAESTDGVDGCNPATGAVDIMLEAGTGATSLQLTPSARVPGDFVSVSAFEPRLLRTRRHFSTMAGGGTDGLAARPYQ